MNNKIRIFLADDHKILRESLQMLLSTEDDFEVVGQASDGLEAMQKLPDIDADILLLDISMPRMSGLELMRNLRAQKAQYKVIFLTMHKTEDMLFEAFDMEANGYVLKENAFDELAQAIRTVYSGGTYVSPALSQMMLNGFMQNERSNQGLSSREKEVLKLLAEGYNNREISEMLVISVKTVEAHRANIMRKYHFKNITELVLYAVRNHIVEI